MKNGLVGKRWENDFVGNVLWLKLLLWLLLLLLVLEGKFEIYLLELLRWLINILW